MLSIIKRGSTKVIIEAVDWMQKAEKYEGRHYTDNDFRIVYKVVNKGKNEADISSNRAKYLTEQKKVDFPVWENFAGKEQGSIKVDDDTHQKIEATKKAFINEYEQAAKRATTDAFKHKTTTVIELVSNGNGRSYLIKSELFNTDKIKQELAFVLKETGTMLCGSARKIETTRSALLAAEPNTLSYLLQINKKIKKLFEAAYIELEDYRKSERERFEEQCRKEKEERKAREAKEMVTRDDKFGCIQRWPEHTEKILRDAFKVGKLECRYNDFERDGTGDGLFYDLYSYTDQLILVQQRYSSRRKAGYYLEQQKSYYVTDGQTVAEVSAHKVHAAIKKNSAVDSPLYAVKDALPQNFVTILNSNNQAV